MSARDEDSSIGGCISGVVVAFLGRVNGWTNDLYHLLTDKPRDKVLEESSSSSMFTVEIEPTGALVYLGEERFGTVNNDDVGTSGSRINPEMQVRAMDSPLYS